MSSSETPSIDLKSALNEALEATRLARQVLINHFQRLVHVSHKEKAGLVSEADISSENVIRDHLKSKFPTWDFLGEEESFSRRDQSFTLAQGPRWIVDPLDGTTNYVHGFPIFCISIGLEVSGELCLGVIDVPILDHIYTAVRGEGAFKNGQQLHVSQRETLAESLVATGFFAEDKPALREQLSIFSCVVPEVRGVRRAGAAAYDLCMVAEGIFDAFWEKNLKPWDTAAGVVLVREAGGIVTTYEGETYNIGSNSLVAGSPHVHDPVLDCVRSALRRTSRPSQGHSQ